MFSYGNSLYIFLFLTTIAISAFSYASTTPAIEIYPQTLTKSGDSVRISWSGIESPSDIDWLGIYNPPNSSDSNFIGYVFLSKCENWRSGSCSIDLPLINLRSNYEFRVFRWNASEVDRKNVDEDHNPLPGTRHILARSEELGFVNFNDPAQIHLSFTENEGEMRVLFLTKDGLKSWIKYGVDGDGIDQIVETKAMTYGRSDMCDSPANSDVGWRDPGFVHDGVMRNLKPGKRYYYQVGSDSGGWSEVHSFISRDGDSDRTIAFLFGDMGTSVPYHTFLRTQEESISTVKWILRDIEELGHKPSFISHIGDISYARGYSWLWDSFFTQIEPIASKVPYHVCIGNHEYDWPLQPWKPSWAPYGEDGGGECGVPYSLKFNMPGNSSASTGNGSPATRNLYYSFNSGVVHFLYLSTETNFLPGSAQYEFIKHDLETLDREKTPFVVVQGHRPMYTTSNEPKDALLREKMLEHLEPLLVKNSVNLVLWGHVHRYERFCPLRNYTCASLDPIPNAGYNLPIHVVIGMGGQDWQPIWEPTSDHPTDLVFPQPEQSVYRGGEFGYVRLVATRNKLTLTYVGNHDGNAHDTVDILLKKEITAADSTFDVSSSVMKSVSLLVFGAFLGYVGGYVYRARREAAQKRNWVAVKTDEV